MVQEPQSCLLFLHDPVSYRGNSFYLAQIRRVHSVHLGVMYVGPRPSPADAGALSQGLRYVVEHSSRSRWLVCWAYVKHSSGGDVLSSLFKHKRTYRVLHTDKMDARRIYVVFLFVYCHGYLSSTRG